ncbi:MAG TPA: Hsp20/alpha crystallin family protein [Treponema sp.]|nr:Hsp20/alpha crystallin family protein [Treponema sp.]
MNALRLFNPTFANDLFDAFDRNYGLTPPVSSTGYSLPKVDVRETNDAYVMHMDLPGLSEKDVEINLKDRVLTIASVQEAEKEDKKKTDNEEEYIIRERRSSCFSRKFSLPQDIVSESVSAEFKNGVLTISIPRKPEAQPRQITIKSA